MGPNTKGQLIELIEPLYGPYDDHDKAPDGLLIPRYCPINSKRSGKAIQYHGSDFNEWTTVPNTFRDLGKLTPNSFERKEENEVILLNPYKSSAISLNLDTLAHRVNVDPTTIIWTEWIPFCKYSPYSTDYEKWTFEVIRKSSDVLKQAGILGAVAVSTGSYNFDPSIVKGVIEMWCSRTNTFVTPLGEIGISLWDLRCIGGLPIVGELYEEYVPPNSELYSEDAYSTTLRDLLNIYQWIHYYASRKTNKVSYFQWTDFFFKNLHGKKRLADNDAHPVPHVSEECRLAAFLSLWLCIFIMPCKGSLIRPETFLIAAKLAKGTRIALAPAVLAYICINLDAMVLHPRGPCYASASLPYHFLYGWITAHFEGTYVRRNTPSDNIKNINGLREIPSMAYISGVGISTFTLKRARSILRKEEYLTWRPFTCTKFRYIGWFEDYKEPNNNNRLGTTQAEYFIALRQSIIPLRLGKELYAQQYNPHRFARQFGYDQGFPEEIQVPKRPQSIGLLIGYWHHFRRRRTGSRFYIPSHEREGHPLLEYAHYWSTKMHTTLKSIYDRLNENDQSTQILKDKAPAEKEISPQTKKRDSSGIRLGKSHTGPSRPNISSQVESWNSPKRIRTNTSSRTHSLPLAQDNVPNISEDEGDRANISKSGSNSIGSYGAPSTTAGPSEHNSLSSYFVIDDDYTSILDVNPPTESPHAKEASKSAQVISSPQHMKEDSTTKATFANDPPHSKNDLVPKANSPPKHRENLTIGIGSMSSSHPQLVGKGSALESFWAERLLQKVKSSHPHEHESLREETAKLHKTLMMHGLDISPTKDKIYEVLDIAKTAHNIKSEGNDPNAAERKELMKNAESIKETRLSLMAMSQRVDKANMKLMLIREKLQELKAQEEAEEQFVSSGMKLLSSVPSIEEVDKSLVVVLEKLEALGGSDKDLKSSLSLAEVLANFEKAKAQL